MYVRTDAVREMNELVPRVVLGRTGLTVSVLGTGGAYSKYG